MPNDVVDATEVIGGPYHVIYAHALPLRTNRGGFEDEARLVVREPAALHEAGVVGKFDLHLVVDASRVRADISSRSLASTGVDAARRPFRRPGAPRRPGRPAPCP